MEKAFGNDNQAMVRAVNELLTTAVDKLKGAAEVRQGETRLFFPAGIELISVELSASPMKVVLKIAGPQGACCKDGGREEDSDLSEFDPSDLGEASEI